MDTTLLRRLLTGLLALGLMIGANACSDDEEDDGTETDVEDSTETTPLEDEGTGTDDTGATDDTTTDDSGATGDMGTEETVPGDSTAETEPG